MKQLDIEEWLGGSVPPKRKPKSRGNELQGLSLYERFQRQYEVCPETGCWLWTARKKVKGYGQIREGRTFTLAHRASYRLHIGQIPKEKPLILHHCDTRNCVNPAHLWAGTHADNMADRNAKGRQASGSQIAVSKMWEPDVILVRAMAELGIPQLIIGRAFGVTEKTIRRITTGKSWRHLWEPVQTHKHEET